MLWDTPNGSVVSPKIWDDVTDLEAIRSYPIEALHRNVEKVSIRPTSTVEGVPKLTIFNTLKIVLDAPTSVRVALVSPGGVYGISTGAGKKFTVPILTSPIVHHGAAFMIGTGASTGSFVHVLDLARLFVLLIGEARKPNGGKADWGVDGYYYAVSQEATIKDLVHIMGEELAKLGHLKTSAVEVLSIEEVAKIHQYMPYLFGTNVRAVATRAKRLGWTPIEASVLESLVTDLPVQNPKGRPFTHWVGLGL